jgi:hypothetical protein
MNKNNKKKRFPSGVIAVTAILLTSVLYPALTYDKAPYIPPIPVVEPEPERPPEKEKAKDDDMPPEFAAYIKENGPIAETKYRNAGSKEPNKQSSVIMVCGDGVFSIYNEDASVSVMHDGVSVQVKAPLSDTRWAQYNVTMGGESKETGNGDHYLFSISSIDRDGNEIQLPVKPAEFMKGKKRGIFKNAVKRLIGAVRKGYPSDVPADKAIICDSNLSGVMVLDKKRVSNAFFNLAGAVQSKTGQLLSSGWGAYKSKVAAVKALKEKQGAEQQSIVPLDTSNNSR